MSGEANAGRLVPGPIAAAVDARLRLLPEATVRFLSYAAMLGRNFDWHVVAAATGCPPQEAIDELRQAARAQLIDKDGTGFRFRHALTAEAVRSSLLPEERQAVCASLLETLQLLHPGLEGETCQLAASLAVEGGREIGDAGGCLAGVGEGVHLLLVQDGGGGRGGQGTGGAGEDPADRGDRAGECLHGAGDIAGDAGAQGRGGHAAPAGTGEGLGGGPGAGGALGVGGHDLAHPEAAGRDR